MQSWRKLTRVNSKLRLCLVRAHSGKLSPNRCFEAGAIWFSFFPGFRANPLGDAPKVFAGLVNYSANVEYPLVVTGRFSLRGRKRAHCSDARIVCCRRICRLSAIGQVKTSKRYWLELHLKNYQFLGDKIAKVSSLFNGFVCPCETTLREISLKSMAVFARSSRWGGDSAFF